MVAGASVNLARVSPGVARLPSRMVAHLPGRSVPIGTHGSASSAPQPTFGAKRNEPCYERLIFGLELALSTNLAQSL